MFVHVRAHPHGHNFCKFLPGRLKPCNAFHCTYTYIHVLYARIHRMLVHGHHFASPPHTLVPLLKMEYMNMRRNTPEYATHGYVTNLVILTCKKMYNIMNSSATCLHNFLIQVKNFPSRQSLRSYLVIYNILLIVFLLFLLIKYRNICIGTKRREPSQRGAHRQEDTPSEEGQNGSMGRSGSTGESNNQGRSKGRGGSKGRGISKRRDVSKSRAENQSRSRNTRKAQITNNSRATSKARNTGKGRNASKGKKTPRGNTNRANDLEQEQNVSSILNSLRSRTRNQKDNVQGENLPINTKRTRRTRLEMTQINEMVASNSLGNVSLPYVDISNNHFSLKEEEKKKKNILKGKKKN
ncbi:conserved Plasmodium protein, unknown function [Plasmodium knowlesi strain H]|uniref:Uncharacterized protein n=3 Tax=Plasmodium knowlesi TaxID=5850 RepID=A0A5K1URA0_PLAKH|nr:conserved Plasmodium protein, unknown function [Plasmodium knowlesi strain H]OTN64812.1 Uncharacterized protein PKNOH_S120162900 [Plasmodium knowlesi]CAA9988485.1 conserved Plasmodium protein, unknown function [Plasmodium knowlesi strain H]SBO19732.1 conserved Plasmodium protein, unknown function [Plasmodium knowlesi strain H]SBO20489.1 conserved Plasmodium protein, unknown function [Plasmodium knowlesi strain H]VVS77959.1 conserved Plasmodium protein, unknown function [Plasmodium knowlesi |eukprot:XP_002259465.1 hypothetical protein, conserved in Plasmodium species [Plasmodium knowlesi strain H]